MSNTLISAAIQLQTLGQIDRTMISNDWVNDPPASLFTYEYDKISQYSKNTVQMKFNESFDFGKTVTLEFPRYGDFLGSITIRVSLPNLNNYIPTGSTYLKWTNTIGYALCESVELNLCGKTIDVQSSVLMDVYDTLNPKSLDVGRYDENEDILTCNSEKDVYIPLRFWFTESTQQYIPLAAMTSGPLKLIVKLRPFNECVIYDGDISPSNIPHISDSVVFVDYFMVTKNEKNIITRNKQSYLIEQWQTISLSVTQNISNFKANLNFIRPVKEIVWVFVETNSIENNDWFNYGSRSAEQANMNEFTSNNNQNIMNSMQFQLDGKIRFDDSPEEYYRKFIAKKYHPSCCDDKNIYVLSFAEFPDKNQPTGSINLSRYDHIDMFFQMIQNNPECTLYVFAKTYNILSFENGVPFLEYL